jgi:DNA-binding CsgD family transcriptional regulator
MRIGEDKVLSSDLSRASTDRRPVTENSLFSAGGAVKTLLTRRELEVLYLLANGADTPEISKLLVISPATARSHVAAIRRKLKAKNRTHAVVRAIAMGVIRAEI